MRPPQLNLQQIVTFYFVAKEGSFSTASDNLFITQSAVTQQIKSLEMQFGVKLFRIKKQRAYLTPLGERLYAYADEFIQHVMMMETFLKTYRLTTLRIGISAALMFYLMPVIDRFKELYPLVRTPVREGTSTDIVGDLLQFRTDICCVGQAGVGWSTYPTGRVTGYRVPEVEKMVFVASPDYPLSTDAESKWEDLAREPLILPTEGSTSRLVVLEHFRRRGLSPIIGTEVDNIAYTIEFALQKKGIALMFWPNVREEVAAGRLKVIPVAGGDIKLGIDILINREIALSPLARDFITLLKDHFGEMHLLHLDTEEVADQESL